MAAPAQPGFALQCVLPTPCQCVYASTFDLDGLNSSSTVNPQPGYASKRSAAASVKSIHKPIWLQKYFSVLFLSGLELGDRLQKLFCYVFYHYV